jgi:hypothetical protein
MLGGNRQLGPDDRLDADSGRGLVKSGSAVHAVAVEERKRRIAEGRGSLDERFGQ